MHHYNKASCLVTGRLPLLYQYTKKALAQILKTTDLAISRTCICCKVFEHIISSAISQHANCYNNICKEQHGFRKNRSCETQLLETINDLAMGLNNGKQIDVDFTFDKVSYQRLLLKLSHYGINGLLFNWIKDYLSNRQQQFILDGAVSSSSCVMSGVPQGSVLGSLLFLLYIITIWHKISSTIRLYADDVIIYRQIYTEEDVLKLQEDLTKLSQWAQDWLMHINLSKWEHLTVNTHLLHQSIFLITVLLVKLASPSIYRCYHYK